MLFIQAINRSLSRLSSNVTILQISVVLGSCIVLAVFSICCIHILITIPHLTTKVGIAQLRARLVLQSDVAL